MIIASVLPDSAAPATEPAAAAPAVTGGGLLDSTQPPPPGSNSRHMPGEQVAPTMAGSSAGTLPAAAAAAAEDGTLLPDSAGLAPAAGNSAGLPDGSRPAPAAGSSVGLPAAAFGRGLAPSDSVQPVPAAVGSACQFNTSASASASAQADAMQRVGSASSMRDLPAAADSHTAATAQLREAESKHAAAGDCVDAAAQVRMAESRGTAEGAASQARPAESGDARVEPSLGVAQAPAPAAAWLGTAEAGVPANSRAAGSGQHCPGSDGATPADHSVRHYRVSASSQVHAETHHALPSTEAEGLPGSAAVGRPCLGDRRRLEGQTARQAQQSAEAETLPGSAAGGRRLREGHQWLEGHMADHVQQQQQQPGSAFQALPGASGAGAAAQGPQAPARDAADEGAHMTTVKLAGGSHSFVGKSRQADTGTAPASQAALAPSAATGILKGSRPSSRRVSRQGSAISRVSSVAATEGLIQGAAPSSGGRAGQHRAALNFSSNGEASMQPGITESVAQDSSSRESSRMSSRQGSHTSRSRLVMDSITQSTSGPASRRISRSSSAVEASPSMGAGGVEARAAAAAGVGMPEAGQDPSGSRRNSRSSSRAVEQGPFQGPVGSQTAAAEAQAGATAGTVGSVSGHSPRASRQFGPSSSGTEQGLPDSHTGAVEAQAGGAAGAGLPDVGAPMSQSASSSQSAVAGPQLSEPALLGSAEGQWGSFVRRSRPQVSSRQPSHSAVSCWGQALNAVPCTSAVLNRLWMSLL